MPNPSRHAFFSLSAWKTQLVFWLGALSIGLITVLLTLGSEAAGRYYLIWQTQYPWIPFLIAPPGLGLLAWLTHRYFQGSERSGIPQIKAALDPFSQTSALLNIRIVIGKIVLSIGGIFCGASVGMGGPSIHVGASVMSHLGKYAHANPHYLERGLILAGSSAGFAALFCAPLAGIVFAIEEMGRSLEEKTSGLILTSVIFAGITSLAILGNYTFFDDASSSMEIGKQWIAIPICAIAAGLLGGLFSRILISGPALLKHVPALTPVRLAIICGVIIAALAVASNGQSTGTGYQETQRILLSAGEIDPWYPLMRMMASIATFFSGIPAGIFVPSLSAGAGVGANMANWFPVAPVSAMILLGMVGYFSGMLRAPLTAFVLVMEITNSHDLLLPMMLTAYLASASASILCPVPLYQAMTQSYLPPSKSDEPSNENQR